MNQSNIDWLLSIDISHLLNKIIHSPMDFSLLPFVYGKHQYQLLPESLIALYIKDIADLIEKSFVIDNTTIQIDFSTTSLDDNTKQIVIERLYQGIINIKLAITEFEEILKEQYELYEEQQQIMTEIIGKRQRNKRYGRILKRTQQ